MKRVCCLIAISILSGFAGCKKAPPSARPEPPHVVEIDPSKCEFAKEAETVWNEAVRDSLDLSVKIMDDVIEAWEAENLTLDLDEFTTDWTSARERACRDHYFDEKTSDEQYREQTVCFDEMLEKARDVIGRMKSGDRAALDKCKALKQALDACI